MLYTSGLILQREREEKEREIRRMREEFMQQAKQRDSIA